MKALAGLGIFSAFLVPLAMELKWSLVGADGMTDEGEDAVFEVVAETVEVERIPLD